MVHQYFYPVLFAFVFSFIFALGGVGSAIVLVPIFTFLGIPLNEAKPVCLFINTLSMLGATFYNLKNRIINFLTGIKVLLPSIVCAPLGVWLSTKVSKEFVLFVFFLFMCFASFMLLFFDKGKFAKKFSERKDSFYRDFWLVLSGVIAGLISGLLGVGGGLLISPVLIFTGYNPKDVAAITAFVVPFSSFIGFVSYWILGFVNIPFLLLAGAAACAGGYLGTKIMRAYLKPKIVKKFLGVVVLLFAIKLFLKLLNH